ncbi:hypothetical protein [Xanthomonas sp. LMG 12461]|uniref:hypothetical protein n=1 Tax=Xanthomonas sp. LMG 12461 TaxID=2014543 RepID=UPI0012643257|nr:hypothetical protein [Xanthomonas sp. LMG 12461]
MSRDGKVAIQRHVFLQSDQSLSMPCAASIRYEKHDPTSLEVELIYVGDSNERAQIHLATRAIDRNLIRLHAVDGKEDSINLLGLTSWTSDTSVLKLEVGAMEIGIDQAAYSHATELNYTVALQPSGILCGIDASSMHHDGNINRKSSGKSSILVETPVGTIEALDSYEYLERAAFGDKVLHQVRRAWLMGSTILKEGDSLRIFHDALLEEAFIICKALSLCYRQPVDAYEIKYLYRDSRGGSYKHALYRRKWRATRSRHSSEELIHSSNLQNGGLSDLVGKLKNHAESISIKRAISFLSASYEGFLETAYFMAFSAMETVVNAVSDKSFGSVSSSVWKRTRRELERSVALLKENGVLSSDVADQIKEKLPELRRASLASKISSVATFYSIKTSDLWTAEGFEEGIKSAARIRNGLFHAAHSSDVGLMEVNLVRIQAFTERLLLAALSWPDDRRWAWRDSRLRSIIQPPDNEVKDDH